MKLTNKQKNQIICEYATGNVSQRVLAEKFNVSQNTISKILNDEKVSQKLSEIENDSLLSMASYINEKRATAQKLVSLALESLEGKISGASVKETAILIDKLISIFNDNSCADGKGKNGNEGENANELHIVIEKKVVDLTKGDDNAEDSL